MAASRSINAVTPDCWAASVSLRLATRSNARVSPQISVITPPSALHASPSAATRNALSAFAARTTTMRRGSSPNSAKPGIDSSPFSRAEKSCRTHSRNFVCVRRCARPATNPVADALWWLPANTSCSAPSISPPPSAASASACPSGTWRVSEARPLSRRSIAPCRRASVLMRAPIMRAAPSEMLADDGPYRTNDWLNCSWYVLI